VLGSLPGGHRLSGLSQRREAKPHLLALVEEHAAPMRTDGGDQLGVGCRREKLDRGVDGLERSVLIGKLPLGLRDLARQLCPLAAQCQDGVGITHRLAA
jgi:hypothetical protein